MKMKRQAAADDRSTVDDFHPPEMHEDEAKEKIRK